MNHPNFRNILPLVVNNLDADDKANLSMTNKHLHKNVEQSEQKMQAICILEKAIRTLKGMQSIEYVNNCTSIHNCPLNYDNIICELLLNHYRQGLLTFMEAVQLTIKYTNSNRCFFELWNEARDVADNMTKAKNLEVVTDYMFHCMPDDIDLGNMREELEYLVDSDAGITRPTNKRELKAAHKHYYGDHATVDWAEWADDLYHWNGIIDKHKV